VVVECDGERHFNFYPGSGLSEFSEPDYARIDLARCILIDTHWPEVQAKAMARARASDVTVVGDFEHVDEASRELMKLTDIPIISAECAAKLSPTGKLEDALRVLAEWGARVAVVTLGAEGCLYLEDGELKRERAIPVKGVATTGAGDAFHGAYCFGLPRDWSTREIIRFATVGSGLNCMGVGGRAGLPTFEEAVKVTRENFPDWDAA